MKLLQKCDNIYVEKQYTAEKFHEFPGVKHVKVSMVSYFEFHSTLALY